MNKVPNLRFKEFSGDWGSKKIGEITIKVGSGKTPKGGNSVYTDEGIIFLRSQNVLNGKLSLDDVAYITEDINSTMKSTEVYPNDILLNITGASIGRSCCVPESFERANVNQHVCIIRLNKNYNSNFVMNQIISSRVQKQINSFQAGGNREGLNFEQIKGMKISSTTLEEQEKIASFFSLIDKKIELQTEKVEELKNYKKGIMQKIFSQELRFKDENGNEYPEWEEKSFQELYLNIPTKQYQIKSSEVKAYGEIEVIDQGKEKICGYTDSLDKIFDNLPVIIYGDHTTNVKFRDEKFVVGADGTKLLGNKNANNDLKFLFYALEFNNIEAEGYKRHFSILKQISLYISKSLSEQIKISKVLSYLDTKIDKEQAKLESLNQYKKGLLQQMFI